jgi:biopolymer transport protein ExbB
MIMLMLLQSDTALAAAEAIENQGLSGETIKFIDLAVKGRWMMIPILLLSIVAVYIFFERWGAISRASKIDINFMNRIKDYIHDGKLDSAHALCQSYVNPVARMIEKGVSRIGRPLNDISAAIENVGKLQIYQLEKGLPLLASVAGGAPMLGFLGTVMGMIRSFKEMAEAGGQVVVQQLSGGIYQALVTTVAGLIVGILAYFAYNLLVSKVEKVIFQLESNSTEFMDLLNEPADK